MPLIKEVDGLKFGGDTASAATVGVTFLGMGFAKLGLFSKAGPALAVGIDIALLAALTLCFPRSWFLAGRRGWIKPRPEQPTCSGGRWGIRIVRLRAHLVASVVILLALASCAALLRYNYDDRKLLSASRAARSATRTWTNTSRSTRPSPEYSCSCSPRMTFRSPRALADLEQMAQRIKPAAGSQNGRASPPHR